MIRFLLGKKKKTIYIAIEIKPRELNSQILLAYAASKLGYRVYIGTFQKIAKLIIQKNQKAGIYHYKGIEKLDQLRLKLNVTTRLDQEIGPALKFVDDIVKKRLSHPFNALFDSYYTIGSEVTVLAKKYLSKTNVKIVETGWPRIDLWRKEFSSIYKKEIASNQSKYGKYILFSSDFGFVNPDRIKIYEQQLKNVEPQLRSLVLENAKKSYEEYKLFLSWLEEFDSIIGFPTLVVRPHPAEDKNVWENDLKTFKNVHCVYDGEVSSWIYGSIAVLHRGCTSGLQAYFASVPVGYLVIDQNNKFDTLPCLVSKHLYSVKDVSEWAKNFRIAKADHELTSQHNKIFNKKIKQTENLAVDEILADFESYDVNPERRLSLTLFRIWIGGFWIIVRRIFKSIIKRKWNKKLFRIYPHDIDKLQNGINYREVRKFLKVLDNHKEIIVRPTILKNLVVISQKD